MRSGSENLIFSLVLQKMWKKLRKLSLKSGNICNKIHFNAFLLLKFFLMEFSKFPKLWKSWSLKWVWLQRMAAVSCFCWLSPFFQPFSHKTEKLWFCLSFYLFISGKNSATIKKKTLFCVKNIAPKFYIWYYNIT